jgi:hypothetical protein
MTILSSSNYLAKESESSLFWRRFGLKEPADLASICIPLYFVSSVFCSVAKSALVSGRSPAIARFADSSV